MEQPEEKPLPPGAKPPHPPAMGKKPGGVPKGPVPPRGPASVPRVPPFGMNPGAPKPPSAGLPPKPPMPGMPGALPKPGMPPMMPGAAAKPPMPSFNKPPMPPLGSRPPMAPPPPPVAALPPAIEGQFSEAEGVKKEMEGRISELEKKLLEEREKVLMASLRGKEEEAVSAKVESSIKEIQDKLRREKREQEMDEARRKAEGRLVDMERRIAEEREAWVATLKSQLNQRDQNTQEMETHFSTRLKDLEYRWAQEKGVLETALRDKESEIVRLKHEGALKSEQEKSFWEDRYKSVISERDKIERDLERAKDRYEQEKEHASLERQSAREQISRLESSLRLQEEQYRTDKAAFHRDTEAQLNILRQQLTLDKTTFEKQSTSLQSQVQDLSVDLREKTTEVQSLETQLAAARAHLNQLEFRVVEKDKSHEVLKSERFKELEDARRRATDLEQRLHTVQGRLDWYDNNVKHEYEMAREKVRKEFEAMEKQMEEAVRNAKQVTGSKEESDKLFSEKRVLEQQLDDLKTEWKQTQWHLEGRIKELSDQVASDQTKIQQVEQAKANMEQELRQRSEALERHQDGHGRAQRELDRTSDRAKSLEKAYELEREKVSQLESQINDYKEMLHGKGIRPTQEFEREIAEKTSALEKMRDNIARLTASVLEAEKKDEIMREKERVFKQMLSGKEDLVSEFKGRSADLERKLDEARGEIEKVKEHTRVERDQLVKQYQEGLDRERSQKKREMEAFAQQKENEFIAKLEGELAKVRAEAEAQAQQLQAQAQAQAPAPTGGVSPQMMEAQIRQQMEMEALDRQREMESSFEARIQTARDDNKKEMDKLKWENESLKEELKRSRESRIQIEREAQELLTQAEDHYKKEISRQMFDLQKDTKQNKGLFSTLGQWLDTPIIDTSKKKEDEGEGQ